MDVYKEVGSVCIMLLGVIPLLKDKKARIKRENILNMINKNIF